MHCRRLVEAMVVTVMNTRGDHGGYGYDEAVAILAQYFMHILCAIYIPPLMVAG